MFTTPLTVDVARDASLTDDVVRNATDAPDVAQFSRRVADGWQDVTTAQFREEVVTVAKGLVASGVQPGDRVALMCRTRYEWTLFDYAIWWAAAVTVPVYDTASADHAAWILADSGAVACVAETVGHRARLEEVRDALPCLEHLWVIDEGAVTTLAAEGVDVDDVELERRRAGVRPDDLATLVYTSGTTGHPKGCMLTHGNLMVEVGITVEDLRELFAPEDSATLLFLPLAHIFARVVQVASVRARVRMGYSADVRRLVEDVGEFRPTFLLAVPRVLEKMFNSASQQAHSEGRGRVFDAAATTAIGYSRATDEDRVGPLLRLRHAAFDRLVYSRLRQALGGRVRYAVSGGAPLGERLVHFFRGAGVPVLEGYGLTETTAALTVNRPAAMRVGTVGQPLAGTSVRVAEDGELLFKGGQVFSGYWHDEQATRAVFDDDGWFHSGDVGEIDADGFVRVTSRKKDILVTAGGKNVAPAGLEDAVSSHPLVSQCMVVGEARPFVAALVTLDRDSVLQWCERLGKQGSIGELRSDPDLLGEIQQAIDGANATVSQAESIRRFAVVSGDWTEESGHLTPTLKLRRTVILRDFADEVRALYG